MEDLSEEVADRLLDFAERLRRRDFTRLEAWFTDDFVGDTFAPLPVREESSLAAGVSRRVLDTDAAQPADRDTFIRSLEGLIGDWSKVESVLWKVKAADFEASRPPWGKVKLFIHFTGRDAKGAMMSLRADAYANVSLHKGRQSLHRLDLTSLKVESRPAPLFTELAARVGLAHRGERFGTEENRSFHWNGAAAGDIDGDGWVDLFVPSDGRNFLYVASADGTWREEAAPRGVLAPDGGTGAVFFDIDRDGDQDLLVGHVGWLERDGSRGGRTAALYWNDGAGPFTAGHAVPGLDLALISSTLTVLDYDLDGWLDVFVACYGRVEVQHNDSWIEASNGAPDALLRNLGRGSDGTFLGFEDVSERAGVRDARWSYASAAADVDGDGWTDLYVANDYGSNRLWLNQRNGTFRDAAAAYGVVDVGNGMGATFGSLTALGELDLYVSNMSSTAGNRILARLGQDLDPETHAMLKKLAAGNSLFLRRAGEPRFDPSPAANGGVGANWAWTAVLFDLDLDADLDVFCTNGFVTGTLAHDT